MFFSTDTHKLEASTYGQMRGVFYRISHEIFSKTERKKTGRSKAYHDLVGTIEINEDIQTCSEIT